MEQQADPLVNHPQPQQPNQNLRHLIINGYRQFQTNRQSEWLSERHANVVFFVWYDYSSFGYEARFEIGERLEGWIKQYSLSFELFVNGKSFTLLQENNKTYGRFWFLLFRAAQSQFEGEWAMGNRSQTESINRR